MITKWERERPGLSRLFVSHRELPPDDPGHEWIATDYTIRFMSPQRYDVYRGEIFVLVREQLQWAKNEAERLHSECKEMGGFYGE